MCILMGGFQACERHSFAGKGRVDDRSMSRGVTLQAPDAWSTPPPPPRGQRPCQSNRAGVVIATFGTVSYFALSKHAPLSGQRWALFPSKFGALVLL